MCGIIGFTYKEEEKLKKAMDKIGHRGPDGQGIFIDENLSLGHLRLSILDLTNSANQPMANKDKSVVIAFNGEIYNFHQLRKSLLNKRCIFVSNSDTEVILHGYEKYGLSFFSKLQGMWSIALYDKKNQSIILSRDHFGIKPLYYSIKNDDLIFSSEIKGIKTINSKLSPNTEQYYQFFNLGYFCSPHTCFKEIFEVEPAQILVWNFKKKSLNKQQIDFFDTVCEIEKRQHSFPAAVDFLENLLLDSVKAHYVSDVPVNLLLSGGNDSSLLAALSLAVGKKPTAYHLKIKGSTDSYYAKKIADYLGLELKIYEMNDSLLHGQYEKIWDFLDVPTDDVSIIPTSIIYSFIKGKSKVVLSGEGGDEMFGGYLRHNVMIQKQLLSERNRFTELLNLFLGSSVFSLQITNPILNRLRNCILKSFFSNDVIGSYLHNVKTIDFPVGHNKIRSYLYDFYCKNSKGKCVPPNLFFDLFLYLSNNLLHKNDIASMASSVEARVPFVDKILYTGVMNNIDSKFLLSKKFTSKKILKKVMEKYLPKKLIYRDKKGFAFSFDVYKNPEFIRDVDEAIKFHRKYFSVFGLKYEQLSRILIDKNRNLLIKKYPRFAFSLVSNYKIFKNIL